MIHCVICGKRFDEEDRFTVCYDCYQDGAVDGSEQHWKLARHLSELRNTEHTLADWKLIADSAAGAWLAEKILEHMDLDCVANLLKKMLKHREVEP